MRLLLLLPAATALTDLLASASAFPSGRFDLPAIEARSNDAVVSRGPDLPRICTTARTDGLKIYQGPHKEILAGRETPTHTPSCELAIVNEATGKPLSVIGRSTKVTVRAEWVPWKGGNNGIGEQGALSVPDWDKIKKLGNEVVSAHGSKYDRSTFSTDTFREESWKKIEANFDSELGWHKKSGAELKTGTPRSPIRAALGLGWGRSNSGAGNSPVSPLSPSRLPNELNAGIDQQIHEADGANARPAEMSGAGRPHELSAHREPAELSGTSSRAELADTSVRAELPG